MAALPDIRNLGVEFGTAAASFGALDPKPKR